MAKESPAVLWMALYFPDLPLELFVRGQPQEAVLAVSHRQGGRDVIARCNAAASAYGVRTGLPLQAALALCDVLQVHARDPEAEQLALDSLAMWAYQYSPQICFEPSMLLLEIGASLRLFGGLEKLLQRVRRESLQLGYRCQWAVAPTPMAAALLARNRPAVQVQAIGQLSQQLADLPLRRFTRDPAVRKLVEDIGLQNLGECLALPRAELARRAGSQLMLLFDRLTGDAADPRENWQPPRFFIQKLDLMAEICHHTALVFPARRLILALCGFLRGSGRATQRLFWSLQHRDAGPTVFAMGLISASRDADHMLEIFRERIERVTLPEPVITLVLKVDECLPYEELSGELLADRAMSADTQLLERLRNRLGETQVQGVCAMPDYRPERAWCFCLPGSQGEGIAGHEMQPPWLLKEPRPLPQADGQPRYAGPLQLQSRPRRIESGWWDGADVSRDYFIALSRVGQRLWVFRDRRSGQWFLHGLFS